MAIWYRAMDGTLFELPPELSQQAVKGLAKRIVKPNWTPHPVKPGVMVATIKGRPMEQTKTENPYLEHLKQEFKAQSQRALGDLDAAYQLGYRAGQAALREESRQILATKKPRKRRPRKDSA